MIGLTIKLIGVNRLRNILSSKDTVKGPLDGGIRKITLKMEGLTKKATVVDTGRLRSSITHKITSTSGIVGTNVQYAEFVEFGTQKMEARHAEGGGKVLGQGMFSYALGQLKSWLGGAGKNIAKDIERKFK